MRAQLAPFFRQVASPPDAGAGASAPAVGWYWMQHPIVRERINVLISGNRHADAYGRLADFLHDAGRAGPLGRCASLGCGTGGLERDLVRRGMVGEIDGYDPSPDAISEARRLAAEQGCGNIRYHVADPPRIELADGHLDAVFTHSWLQNVEALDEVVASVRRVLKPDGIFHLNEFAGPSRFQWSGAQMEFVNNFLSSLPDRLLRTPGGRKPPVQRPDLAYMLAAQPTLAVRSAEIREVVARYFDIVEERPFGGTLLHIGLSEIAQNFDPDDPDDVAQLKRFFDIEDQLIADGTLASDFTVITAMPASAFRSGGAPGKPALFGMAPTRQLRPPPAFAAPGLNLTVSKMDTMLGDNDAHYVAVGQSAMAAIERALDGAAPRAILDLPCGFGRVTRALRARFPDAAITVSDLDRPGVDFSALEFRARPAYSVRDFRELDLGETYDLIWVGSLVTHLPIGQTKHLLSALRRHLSPTGVLLVTVQGPSIIPRLRQTGYGLSPEQAEGVIADFERSGFGYRDYIGGEDMYGVSLTNENYGISLTNEAWMAAALAECGLRLAAYEVQAWDNHHDIAVGRRVDV